MLKQNYSCSTNRTIHCETKNILVYSYFWITIYNYPLVPENIFAIIVVKASNTQYVLSIL